MGIDKAQVQALLDKPTATPDELVQMMRDLTSPLIPFFSRDKSTLSEQDRKEEDAIAAYQKWIDGWRAGVNAKSDYPEIVKVGKQLLSSIASYHLNMQPIVTFSGPNGRGASTGTEGSALSKESKERAEKSNEELKEGAIKAAKFVGEAASGVGDLLLKVALGYFLIQALKETAQKKILRGI